MSSWTKQPFIGGKFQEAAARLPVTNPASEEVFAAAGEASPVQFEAAILAARKAFDDGAWADKPARERAAAIHRLMDHLDSRRDELRSAIVAEAGCPVGSMVMFAQLDAPLLHGRQVADFFCTLTETEDNPVPLADRLNAAGMLVQSVRQYRPVGVVAAITAYNFPFYTNIWKVIPALMAGNSVVLRPNPLTPLSAMVFAEAAVAAGLPPGVLNVVAERGAEGAVLLSTHPAVDMVAFTGSTAVGVKVMQQAAASMKRLQLELGGKSAQIFLPDALDAAVQSPLSTCLAHAGQGCVLPTRVLVPRDRKEAVLEGMRAALAPVVLGDPLDPNTHMGPVISAAQRDRCGRYVELGMHNGARVVTGGRRPAHLNKGFYFEPTVLDVPDNSNPAARDEIFGPVVSVIGYDDLEHAVRMANDSAFGLAAYVVGKDRRQALAVGQKLRAGTVNVNGGLLSAYASSGGWGLSGVGRERGVEGIRVYQNMRCMNISG
ncbi:MAG TPA: aldehyde dehydrogenase family protein [Burkholderiales bacterium]|nr:aldehyde dehydrogenase family protein [Burkholderiales bacterium]